MSARHARLACSPATLPSIPRKLEIRRVRRIFYSLPLLQIASRESIKVNADKLPGRFFNENNLNKWKTYHDFLLGWFLLKNHWGLT